MNRVYHFCGRHPYNFAEGEQDPESIEFTNKIKSHLLLNCRWQRSFVNLSAFHHEDHTLKGTNVFGRIALDGDQVGVSTSRQAAQLAFPAQQLGRHNGR